MSYKIITYRSRKLKDEIIDFSPTGEQLVGSFNESEYIEDVKDEILDPDRKLTRKERKAQKKLLKQSQKDNIKTYIINGEEVEESDLTEEELAGIKAAEIINKDSFYDALEPLDNGEYTKMKYRDNKMAVVLLGIGALVLTVSVIIFFVISRGGGI